MSDASGQISGALDIISDAVLIVRASGQIEYANAAGRELLGEYGNPGTLVDMIERGEKGVAEALANLRTMSGNLPIGLVLQPLEGEPRTMKAIGRRIRTAPGAEALYALKIVIGGKNRFATLNQKITELDREVRQRRLAQKQAEDALEANRLLTRELHHRVNNNLQIQASLLRQSAREAATPEIGDFVREATGRLRSMSTGLDLSYRSGHGAVFEISSLLEKMVSQIDETLEHNQDLELVLEGDFLIGNEQVTPVALIIHETVRALIKSNGTYAPIRIQLKCWTDADVGQLDIAAAERADNAVWLASTDRLIKSLAKQAGATFEWAGESGNQPRLSFPMISS